LAHRTRQVAEEELMEADRVYAMSFEHVHRLRRLFGHAADHVTLLDPAGGDVADPFGGPDEAYEESFRRLEGLIQSRLPEILRLSAPTRTT
jgi:protein-tyrosine-phosphatase